MASGSADCIGVSAACEGTRHCWEQVVSSMAHGEPGRRPRGERGRWIPSADPTSDDLWSRLRAPRVRHVGAECFTERPRRIGPLPR